MIERNMGRTVMRGSVHPAGVEEHITRGRIASETGRSHVWPSADEACGPHREGEEPKPMMYGRGKSDEAIVAGKPANKAERSAAEQVERRAEAKGNVRQRSRAGLSTGVGVLSSLAACAPLLPRWRVWTRGGSRMRESCTYGFVRGARSNPRPYRDPVSEAAIWCGRPDLNRHSSFEPRDFRTTSAFAALPGRVRAFGSFVVWTIPSP